MAFRLVGELNETPLSFTLRPGRNVVGSVEDCDVRLQHPSVSRRHAELWVTETEVRVKDLRSLNGTYVESARVVEQELAPGVALAFGRVALRLEKVARADTEPALLLDHSIAPRSTSPVDSPRPAIQASTVGTRAVDVFATEATPEILQALAAGADTARVAAMAGRALFETLPVTAVEIHLAGKHGTGIAFEAKREVTAAVSGTELRAAAGPVEVRCVFLDEGMARVFRPLVQSAALLVRLADVRAEPLPPAPDAAPPPLPQPPSVVPEVQQLYADAARVARGEVGVLICGESGTGKEVLARYIHAASPRAKEAFVALNCAALPRDLLEAELFGIERGVATGVDARPGKFELADGGTLFLDELGDMAADTQARMLRVLQEGEVFRLGGTTPRQARVRVLAATNRDMAKLLADGSFREDLYYRIATWVVELPPLRKRRADIPNLSAAFLAREAARNGVAARGISRAALDVLMAAPWPGNIRQLEKEIARAVLFLRGRDLLDTSCLSPQLQAAAPVRGSTLKETLEQTEREEILRALEAHAGDVAKASEALGVGKSTLYRRMKELNIDAPPASTPGR